MVAAIETGALLLGLGACMAGLGSLLTGYAALYAARKEAKRET